jgi:hypothetical protein
LSTAVGRLAGEDAVEGLSVVCDLVDPAEVGESDHIDTAGRLDVTPTCNFTFEVSPRPEHRGRQLMRDSPR